MDYKGEGESPRERQSLKGLFVYEHESLREMSFVRVKRLEVCDGEEALL